MSEFNERVIAHFRQSNGVVGAWGDRLVLIHHRGVRTGLARINPAMSVRDGGTWMVVGSAMGAPSDPAWVGNLRAHPRTVIEVAEADGISEVSVTAQELSGTERERAFARFVRMAPSFGQYQANAGRLLPVIRFVPRSPSA